MKPTDLRLGNYVRIRDNNEIVKVERLSYKKVGFHYGNDKSRGYFRKYSEIEPVLIFDHSDKIKCLGLTWFPDKGIDESLLYDYLGTTVSYIHELQNLHYALTGNEIEIEL